MPSHWYIYTGPGEEDGPFTSEQMRNHANLGNITPDTPIRRHDMKNWVKARSLTNLFPDGQKMPSGYYRTPKYQEQNETISMSVADLAKSRLEHDPDLAALLGLESWEEVLEPDPQAVAEGRARVIDHETGIIALDSGPPLAEDGPA
jgi:hypothetical protein